MNWKAGDRAVLYAVNPTKHKRYVGGLCTIISLTSDLAGCFSVDIDECPSGHPNGWVIKPKYLRPIYDGNEKSEWDEEIFVPKTLERI